MKKFMVLGAVVFAFALTTSVAFAFCGMCGFNPCPCPEQSNSAYNVTNEVSAVSTTGINSNAYVFGSAGITTGGAGSAVMGINAINSNLKTGMSFGPSAQTNKAINVANTVAAGSYTGQNTNTYTGCATINTGGALSAAKGINLVNTNVKIGCPCAGQPNCGC